jgi:hypothetical protein
MTNDINRSLCIPSGAPSSEILKGRDCLGKVSIERTMPFKHM